MSIINKFFGTVSGQKLPHYLRTHRKRLGLSQKDVAFLLGCESGSKLSRYEKYKATPQLETAFMCGFITCQPLNDLFDGICQVAAYKVKKKARILLRRYRRRRKTAAVERKIEILEAILAGQQERG